MIQKGYSGATTKAGHPIIYLKPAGPRLWAVLCDISDHNDVHPYVVWWMNDVGDTVSGEYCADLEEAVKRWEARK